MRGKLSSLWPLTKAAFIDLKDCDQIHGLCLLCCLGLLSTTVSLTTPLIAGRMTPLIFALLLDEKAKLGGCGGAGERRRSSWFRATAEHTAITLPSLDDIEKEQDVQKRLHEIECVDLTKKKLGFDVSGV